MTGDPAVVLEAIQAVADAADDLPNTQAGWLQLADSIDAAAAAIREHAETLP